MAASARMKLVCGLLVVLALAASSVSAPSGSAQSVGGLQFTDWTSTGGSLATGTLLGRTVTLSGWRLSELGPSYLDGTLSLFSAPYFTPPLPHSDAIEFRAEELVPHSYTLSFGGPTTDPVLHLGSLGTTLEFPQGTSITRLSGKNDGFAVAGSTITGAGDTTVDAYGLNDSNGTVRLNGTFSSITFTASTTYHLDGIILQVGAPRPPGPGPTPAPPPNPAPAPAPAPPAPAPRATVSIHVTGIEVTQGIQEDHCAGCIGTLPSRDPANPNRSGHAAYQGVRMAAGHFTVVRVFAKLDAAASIASLKKPTARLVVMDAFNRQVSVLSPDSSPATLYRSGRGFGSCSFCVRLEERANPTRSFNFLIPWQQTFRHTLNFRAIVRPPVGPGLPRQCASCTANVFDLTGVPFVSTSDVRIHPIPLTVNGARTSKSENQIFGTAQAVLPVNVQVLPYEAPLAVDGMNSDQAAAAVAMRAGAERLDNAQFPIGVFIEPTADLGGLTLGGRVLYQSTPASIVRDNRPLTSIMHEIGHGLGLVHADTGSFVAEPKPGFTGPHPDGSEDCGGGNSGDQVGEAWPPDNKGRIRAVGLTAGAGTSSGRGRSRGRSSRGFRTRPPSSTTSCRTAARTTWSEPTGSRCATGTGCSTSIRRLRRFPPPRGPARRSPVRSGCG